MTFCEVMRPALDDPLRRLRSECGVVIPLPVDRWWAEPSPVEHEILTEALPAALDVGCGPGRHTTALERRGIAAVGVDTSAEAVRAARARGAAVLQASIFDDVPGAGWWGTALLLDGNIGIGGDPESLMARLRDLLRPAGRALVEVEAPGVASARLSVRAESENGASAEWFPWAQVGADDLLDLADATGYEVARRWTGEGRWFARLDAR